MSFLMDTNTFVTPSRLYYQFSLFPQVWDFLKERIEEGSIFILDKVKDEILAPSKEDDLAKWFKQIEIKNLIKHKEQQIVNAYAQVVQSIHDDICYKDTAIAEWSKPNVADPWLIASAKVYKLTIVTFETCNHNLNSQHPSRNAKIPDIASKFNISVIDLYKMLKELKFCSH